MTDTSTGNLFSTLDPIERVSEVLFGVIMALTFTCTLAVATADSLAVKTMVLGVLGCNLAWGIIDAGVYLVARLADHSRKILLMTRLRDATDFRAAHEAVANALPPLLASALQKDQLEAMRQKLVALPVLPESPALTRRDWKGAVAVCLLSFLSAIPIVVPFLLIGDVRIALRVSNLVAVVMLFLCGYALGRRSTASPWKTGLLMVVFGAAMVGIAIPLGG